MRCGGVPALCDDGVPLRNEEGLFQPYPVEYKRGSPREDRANELQLCGQALCLEEMLCCDIPKGALYFGEMRRRVEVAFTPGAPPGGHGDSVYRCIELYKRGIHAQGEADQGLQRLLI